MRVVATAGHVDHGKSTLVRALTGMEPDRWAEERRRGMTIDLGYAWTYLPSGEQVAFVDVPGHQRFIANMLAGIGPAPAVLFVVAADEGWRRQSAEHLAALDALGVRHGLLVVTRSDLLEPELAMEEALEQIGRSSLGAVEAVAVSGQTGSGLAELRAALDRLVGALPPPLSDARLRLWVDRVFTIRGSGTVVTGTLSAGTLRVGDELALAPSGRRVRVRGLESLKSRAEEVSAVARVAVNLRGVDLEEVRRGDALVMPDTWPSTQEVDVRLSNPGQGVADHGPPSRPAGIQASELPEQLMLHVGSAGVTVHVRPLSADTARLRLTAPLPLQVGDRALLRDPGEQRVAAGVLVLDAVPPSIRRRGAASSRAIALAELTGRPDLRVEVARRGAVTRRELAALGVPPDRADTSDGVLVIGDWLVDPQRWADWQRALAAAVDQQAAEHSLDPGLPAEAARRAIGVPDPRLLDALVEAADGLVARDGRVSRPGSVPAFSPAVAAALEGLTTRLRERPFAAPEQPELDALGLSPALLAAAERAGLLLRLPGGITLLADVEEEAVRRLAQLPQPFTTSQARQTLDTTRRVAVPLLEHLDRRRRTRRLDAATREVWDPAQRG